MRNMPITRRRLLVTAGSGTLALTILNTVTGCSDAAEPAPGEATAGPAGSAPVPGSSGPAAGDWRRVDLSFVSAYLLIRGAEAAVVDLGTAGSAGPIESALKAAGSGWASVRHVILTHQHADHAGGLAGVPAQLGAALHAGEADIAGITSARALEPVRDGDEIFGLRIVGTPGHTAGHVSVFDPSTGVLVAGDALRTTGEGLAGPAPEYTADAARAAASVRKLAALDVRTILPGHGDPLTSGAADALARLAASLPG